MATRNHNLTRGQKNKIFRVFKEEEDVPPDSFTWVTVDSKRTKDISVSKCKLPGTDYYFLFDLYRGRHFVEFRPNKDGLRSGFELTEWGYVFRPLREWLVAVRPEIAEPDLWESVFSRAPAIVRRHGSNDEFFSAEERAEIRTALLRAKAYMEHECGSSVEMEKLEEISNSFEYLIEALERMKKTDWIHTCIGVLVTLAAALGWTSEEIGFVWEIVRGVLEGAIQLLP